MLPVSLYCPFFIAPSVFSNIYLSCVLCPLCCQFISIALFYCLFGILKHVFVLCHVYPMLAVSLDCPFLLPLQYSLTFFFPVSCVPYVASFSGLSFFIAPSAFSNICCFFFTTLELNLYNNN